MPPTPPLLDAFKELAGVDAVVIGEPAPHLLCGAHDIEHRPHRAFGLRAWPACRL